MSESLPLASASSVIQSKFVIITDSTTPADSADTTQISLYKLPGDANIYSKTASTVTKITNQASDHIAASIPVVECELNSPTVTINSYSGKIHLLCNNSLTLPFNITVNNNLVTSNDIVLVSCVYPYLSIKESPVHVTLVTLTNNQFMLALDSKSSNVHGSTLDILFTIIKAA